MHIKELNERKLAAIVQQKRHRRYTRRDGCFEQIKILSAKIGLLEFVHKRGQEHLNNDK